MSPVPSLPELLYRSVPANETVTKPTDRDGLILEAWAEGYMVGSLIILSCITFANMRKGVLLHKLILLEVSYVPWHTYRVLATAESRLTNHPSSWCSDTGYTNSTLFFSPPPHKHTPL
jgi:hypothetical protein